MYVVMSVWILQGDVAQRLGGGQRYGRLFEATLVLPLIVLVRLNMAALESGTPHAVEVPREIPHSYPALPHYVHLWHLLVDLVQ